MKAFRQFMAAIIVALVGAIVLALLHQPWSFGSYAVGVAVMAAIGIVADLHKST